MSTTPENQTIGIVGLGLLGRGIAACMLAAGMRVIAFTKPREGYAAAREEISNAIADLVTHGEIPASMMADWPDRYVEADSLQEMRACSYVIESIPEQFDLKDALFAELETIVAPTVPLASNTSALPISILQRARKHPERVIGMHWASPAHISRFLEIIRGDQTNDATVDATMSLARAAGKDPSLVRKDIPGFIINRLAYALYREAFYLLEQGVADVETIDKTVRNVIGVWASVAGPFRWMDLTGLAAYGSVMDRLFPELSNAKSAPALMQSLVAQGHTGSAAGKGFYDYTAQDAERWQAILDEQAWVVREIQARHFSTQS